MLARIICLVLGYLLGSIIQGGYWLGRFNHIDIRNYGSGNAGTTNVMRTLGKKYGALTYLLDIFKVILAGIIVNFFIAPHFYVSELLLFLYAGFGTVLGHNFPFYLGFKGGKGIAATSGLVIALIPFPHYCFAFTLFGLITFPLVLFLTKYVSLASLIGIAGFFIEFVIWDLLGFLPLNGTEHIEGCVIVFLFAALGYIRHAANIKRLINGTERKMGEKNGKN